MCLFWQFPTQTTLQTTNTFEHEMGQGGGGGRGEGWCRMTHFLAPIQDTDGVTKL